jgi:beta-lactamase regulating signal transducer with metallopeptidase domain
MIAVWMVYTAAWGLWLSAIAWVTERILLARRGPVRFVWLAAVILSVFGPIAGYALARRAPAPAVAPATIPVTATSGPPVEVDRAALAPSSPERAINWDAVRAVAARADRPLVLAWMALSLAMLIYIGGGLLRLRIVRRRWQSRVVGDTPVLVSDDVGPALVGVFETTIVIPAWALTLEPKALILMLRHELEHRAAGDTKTLAIAQTFVVLMPWNPMAWWQLRRLRLAIELDCDARVLRGPVDVAAYGNLLLEFGRVQRVVQYAGAALVDHATDLEARIRRMTKRARMPRASAVALSVLAGALAIAVGCQLPAPPAPAPSAPRESRGPVVAAVDSTPKADAKDSLAADARRRAESLFEESKRRSVGSTRDSSRPPRPTNIFTLPVTASDTARQVAQLLELFNASFAVDTTKDPALRASYQRLLNSYAQQLDSVNREMRRLGQLYTPDHPQMKALEREMETLKQRLSRPSWPTDSLLASQSEPGCSTTAGVSPDRAATVKLMLPERAASSGGRLVFASEVSSTEGVMVAFERLGIRCVSVAAAELRAFGLLNADAGRIVMRSSYPLSVVVTTASGRVLAGPVAVRNEARDYEVTWTAR